MSEQANFKSHTRPDSCDIRHTSVVNDGDKLARPVLLKAVPVTNNNEVDSQKKICSSKLTEAELPCCSSSAIVPLSTSLPSKLLRYHSKLSAQAQLHQIEQSQFIDSKFGSEEDVTSNTVCYGSVSAHDCAELYDLPTPTVPTMSLSVSPLESATSSVDDKMLDVGMGSSIDDSEESEEDDELKPLAVDNHKLLHNIDLSTTCERRLSSPKESQTTAQPEQQSQQHQQQQQQHTQTAVLSEANLRKHHHQHHENCQMDNIYLHPNFKCKLDQQKTLVINKTIEPKRVHRSFLTLKKTTTSERVETKPININDDNGEQNTVINEIDTLDHSLIPNDELAIEIAEAVEYYFSNESILKDAFLLKHVRRNKEGFVSLKLVSSFKRVRQLTKDWKIVGNAVRRKSQKIELNVEGTKVRRIEALPNFDETMPSRTIVVSDLQLDKLTIEKVSEIFSKCGEIALIRVLKPGMAIPIEVRQFMNKYPEMQQKECALVEYLESTSARGAKNLVGPFQVYEMVAPKKKTGKKAVIQMSAPVTRIVENYRYYNHASCERTRGGSFSGIMHDSVDLRFRVKRNNSDYHPKTISNDMQQHYHQEQQLSGYYPHHQQQKQQPYQGKQSTMHRGNYGEHTHTFQEHQPRNCIRQDASTHLPTIAGNINFSAYSPRRYGNTANISTKTATAMGDVGNTIALTLANGTISSNNNNIISNIQRRLSNCSDTNYSGSGEIVRRTSNSSESTPQRRDSNCSENCHCFRRVSDFVPNEDYRKTSICSNGSCGERRLSNGSMQFEPNYSNASESNGSYRRMSYESNMDQRKQSIETQMNSPYEQDDLVGGGGSGYNVFPRRYSNNYNNHLNNKLVSYENAQYINGRRISTDSGYDRRYSFGSEYEGSPRSRTSSFLNNYKHGIDYDGQPRSRTGSFLDGSPRSRSGSFAQRVAENLVRTPIGPDGSKGFGARTRKFGQAVSPV